MDKYLFQYCQKIVVFSADNTKVLLAKRKGESDFDSTYSFIGGKMETTDKDCVDGMRREKNEEVGENFIVRLNPIYNSIVSFIKKDGHYMILPHYYAQYIKGEVKLNEEYSDYQWVNVSNIDTFSPIIFSIPSMVKRMLKLLPLMNDTDFIQI